ncbi:Post-GPI attachment to proteins factor 3 [Psidium guajava]|nr:Post-GPI attachment to proteins factor 3 [Psidium guajava]
MVSSPSPSIFFVQPPHLLRDLPWRPPLPLPLPSSLSNRSPRTRDCQHCKGLVRPSATSSTKLTSQAQI